MDEKTFNKADSIRRKARDVEAAYERFSREANKNGGHPPVKIGDNFVIGASDELHTAVLQFIDEYYKSTIAALEKDFADCRKADNRATHEPSCTTSPMCTSNWPLDSVRVPLADGILLNIHSMRNRI